MQAFSKTPILDNPTDIVCTDTNCLEYQTTHIEQRLFTQTQTSIVYNHCSHTILGTSTVAVPNYFVWMPIFLGILITIAFILNRIIRL